MKIASLAGDGIARLCSENGVLTRGRPIDSCGGGGQPPCCGVAYPGTWQTSSAPSCSTACGQSATTHIGEVYCSGGTCDPNTEPSVSARTTTCSATEACSLWEIGNWDEGCYFLFKIQNIGGFPLIYYGDKRSVDCMKANTIVSDDLCSGSKPLTSRIRYSCH